MRDMARLALLGMSGVREGPAIRLGITVMRSMLFSSANFHAAFSASVFDTGYPYKISFQKIKSIHNYLIMDTANKILLSKKQMLKP